MPPNATEAERAFAGAMGDALTIGVPIRDIWSPERCPAAFLPWLAWTFSVDQWDRDWPDTTKRAVIAESLSVHRSKGSRGSIERALAALGFPDAIIIEGADAERYDGTWLYDGTIVYGTPGHWATYRIILPQPITNAQADLVRQALATVAPARSHLLGLDFTEAVALYDASILYDGTFNYGVA